MKQLPLVIVFLNLKTRFTQAKTHTLHLGHIWMMLKRWTKCWFPFSKNSYTGENTIEISCHGSKLYQQQIIQLLLRKGCRMADQVNSLRAFLTENLICHSGSGGRFDFLR
jgi:tRNA modification GTPase